MTGRVTAAQWVTAIISAIGLLGGVLGGISTLRSANAAAEKSEADRDELQFARLEREIARLGEALDAAQESAKAAIAEAREATRKADAADRRVSALETDLTAAVAYLQDLHDWIDRNGQGPRPIAPWRVRALLDAARRTD